ncbi:unnamed protein product [Brugia pahangi]|uniref:Col_cuticle_N domain-containing protein n=1 Tax=Brugia pahangi TaxID=6280 RepID=A0A0N4TKB1_BRUPA|nr:unnamed protein product [Brugia pahangi]
MYAVSTLCAHFFLFLRPCPMNFINIALKGFNFFSINNDLNHIWIYHFHYNFNYNFIIISTCVYILSLYETSHFPDQAPKRPNSSNMFATRISGLTATVVSVGTIIVAFLYIPLIIMKITEMNERSSHLIRISECQRSNPCSSGSPGLPGKPGEDGMPGKPGISGTLGLSGNAIPVTANYFTNISLKVYMIVEQQLSTMFLRPARFSCLQGQEGTSGPGRIGGPGRTGYAGVPGVTGEMGARGKSGEPGSVGLNGTCGQKSLPGKKDEPGSFGTRGLEGYRGRAGQRGKDGETGSQGPAGGIRSPLGQNGAAGMPGEDAQYCSCPPRMGSRKSSYREVDIESRIPSVYTELSINDLSSARYMKRSRKV